MTTQQATTFYSDILEALEDLKFGRTQTALTEDTARSMGFAPNSAGSEYAIVIVGQQYDVWAR